MSLEIEQISKRIGINWIFRDISFSAQPGRIFGLCGPTGSGKSAILRSIAGTSGVNGGSIKLNGIDLTLKNAKQRGFQLLTGHETKRWLIPGRVSKDSSGQTQLAEFEKFIARSGNVLLLDEPFTHLDNGARQRCLNRLREFVHNEHRTVIFASSDFQQISSVADTAAIVSKGSILQTGTPQDIYENPETTIAAEISGDINLFPARRITSTEADLPEFQTIEGGHRIFSSSYKLARLGAINQNVTLAIRPENISMSMGASFPEDNLLKAVVVGVRFGGATSLIEFDAGGIRLAARVFRVVGLNIGDECMLGLPPKAIRVLTH